MNRIYKFLGAAFICLASGVFSYAQTVSGLFDKIQGCELPVVSYQVGEVVYDSFSQDAPIRLTYEAVPYEYGLKGIVTFENISADEVKLHNIVPFGVSPERVHITGKGYHGLSRTYLFRPGYEPVNVIVPDNAWVHIYLFSPKLPSYFLSFLLTLFISYII